jgi:hypothetical protein
MDTDKLVKAIQIIVKEELKTIVPKLVKEGVKKEMTKLLKENKHLRETLKSQKPQQPTFMDTPVAENKTQSQRQLSNNPLLNEVLNETHGFNSGQSTSEEYRTMNFTTNMAQGGVEGMKAQMAAKMGLSDMSMGAQPTGLGVSTGNPVVDKALNRDYSGLMKAIDKKKGPWRPGM